MTLKVIPMIWPQISCTPVSALIDICFLSQNCSTCVVSQKAARAEEDG